MPNVILDATRTPIGSFGGSLKDIPAPELGALCIRTLTNVRHRAHGRNGIMAWSAPPDGPYPERRSDQGRMPGQSPARRSKVLRQRAARPSLAEAQILPARHMMGRGGWRT